MRLFSIVATGLAIAITASTGATSASPIMIMNGQIRAVPAGVPNSAAYIGIMNMGSAPDRLVGASCACAARAEVHSTSMTGGVMRMAPASPVIAPRSTLTFAPGGLHLMLLGLKAPLKEGASVPITLTFEHAGRITASFKVSAKIAAGAMAH